MHGETHMNYGKILKEIRTYDLITQEEVAKKLGISKKTYGLYEIQIRTIPLKHLNVFCDYFNISFDYFFKSTSQRNYLKSKKKIDYIKISQRLKEFRKEKKLTQEDIVQKINCQRSTFSKYENGINKITLDFLYQICKKYNISADYLLGKIDSPKYLN